MAECVILNQTLRFINVQQFYQRLEVKCCSNKWRRTRKNYNTDERLASRFHKARPKLSNPARKKLYQKFRCEIHFLQRRQQPLRPFYTSRYVNEVSHSIAIRSNNQLIIPTNINIL